MMAVRGMKTLEYAFNLALYPVVFQQMVFGDIIDQDEEWRIEKKVIAHLVPWRRAMTNIDPGQELQELPKLLYHPGTSDYSGALAHT